MLMRCLVVVGWMGLTSLFVNVAIAEDAAAPPNVIDGVNLRDPLAGDAYSSGLEFGLSGERGARFASVDGLRDRGAHEDSARRQVEVSLVARGARAGLPLDVGFAQRASMSVNDQGDIERQGRGAELRLGRGLPSMRRQVRPTWDNPAWYFFAASDDEALTWQPGVRNAFGGSTSTFALQDRVEIGDMQAGITYEANGLQASLAYVEREISYQSGSRNFSQDESFTGLTLTMRR